MLFRSERGLHLFCKFIVIMSDEVTRYAEVRTHCWLRAGKL